VNRVRIVRRLSAAAIALALSATASLAQTADSRYAGRSLEDALRLFQSAGLRIIFSSEVVRRDMRVEVEPRGADLRRQLDEVLAPHGLVASPGPAGIIIIWKAARGWPRPGLASGLAAPVTARATADPERIPLTRHERVTVAAPLDAAGLEATGSAVTLRSPDLDARRDGLTDDPLRALQTLPQAAAVDDFRGEFSVRASPPRHIGVVVDGVSARWLQHTAPGRADAGTLTMFPVDTVEQVTLQTGAYPRTHGDHLGAEIAFTLREGSRIGRRLQATVNRMMACVVVEGPIGEAARGSWLASIRRSHIEWPLDRTDHDSTVFGLSDALVRFVYDVTPTQQVSIAAIAGQSAVERDNPDPAALADGSNRAAWLNAGWRSVLGSRLVVRQRLAAVVHEFVNLTQSHQVASAGDASQWLYRSDATYALPKGMLEAGSQVVRERVSWAGPTDDPPASPVRVDWWTTSAYAHYRWSGRRLTLAPGFRVSGSTQLDRPVIDRWIAAEWRLPAGWTLHGSTGASHQGPRAAARRPERARHVDIGVGQRNARGFGWRVTAFSRAERDVVRPYADSRDGGRDSTGTLSGTARGIEVSVERFAEHGLNGWAGYTFGHARYARGSSGVTFPADFDRRHVLNAGLRYTTSHRLTIGATLRAGTNVPMPHAVSLRTGPLHAGADRPPNRLPPYARLDLHVERVVDRGRLSLTMFADVVNALDRRNVALIEAWDAPSAQPTNLIQGLYPRLYSGGVRLAF
jgi:hypothetical protein